MAITAATSSLGSIANNIVRLNSRSDGTIAPLRREFDSFGRFLDIKTLELERTELPSANQIKKLSNINVLNTFGSAGGLLSSLASGALDLGGFITDFFSGRNNKLGKGRSGGGKTASAKAKPTIKGSKLKIPGMRAAPIVGTIFAGLDFATGLAEGESIGKSAAGTAGSLAGSMLGGVIGQTLIPVPGLGFVIGSAVGGFLGGWSADRAYDTGSSMLSKAQSFQQEKLRDGGKKEGKTVVKPESVEKQNRLINNFDDSVSKFSNFVDDIFDGKITLFESPPMDDASSSGAQTQQQPEGEDELMTVEGGTLPTGPPAVMTSPHGWRWGRIHTGVDYAIAINTPVSVIKSGKVIYAGWQEGGYGNVVEIEHSNGLTSRYAHLNKVNVKVNQQIEPGTVIGLNGSTGRSTGPHVHFELLRGGRPQKIDSDAGNEYFRFGGNVKVQRRPRVATPGTLMGEMPSGIKPGQTTQSPYGQQSSAPLSQSSKTATVRNFKGYLIVPGHITGDGTEGEQAAVEKAAMYVVRKIKAEFPGVPVELWNDRNYGQNKQEYSRQQDDLKKKEKEGWQIIELHFDQPQGVGRGVILPNSELNPLDVRLQKLGEFTDPKYRTYAGPSRNLTLFEMMRLTPELRRAIESGDQRALDYATLDFYNSVKESVMSGEIPGYRPPSRVSARPTAQDPTNISYNLPYNRTTPQSGGTTIIAMNTPQQTSGGGGGVGMQQPIQPSSGGGGNTVLADNPFDVRKVLYNLNEARIAVG
jgi:murein DD-endopeptidase MepM/ murein hydrolase activator NlpD